MSDSSRDRISVELSGVRSSWLMLARNSLLYLLASSSSCAFSTSTSAALREFVFLMFEQLRLFFELRIGLFEFGLLRFELRARFAQRAALFFQFLVADAQFFLLRLQFFRLALRFFEQIFQPAAIFRRAHAHADDVARAHEEFVRLRHRADG